MHPKRHKVWGMRTKDFGFFWVWGFCRDSHRFFSVGMGWVWELKSSPHWSLMVIIRQVTRGLTVMETSYPPQILRRCLRDGSTWAIRPPATLPLLVVPRTASSDMPSVRNGQKTQQSCKYQLRWMFNYLIPSYSHTSVIVALYWQKYVRMVTLGL